MKSKQSLPILAIFVLAAVFSTVPNVAGAVFIQNSVSSYANSGGQSQSGQAGENGKDGEDGQNGRSGGATVKSIISGDGTATVKLKSAVNGETVIDIEKQSENQTSADINIEISQSNESVSENSSSTATSTKKVYSDSQILNLLISIRLKIIEYVSQLF